MYHLDLDLFQTVLDLRRLHYVHTFSFFLDILAELCLQEIVANSPFSFKKIIITFLLLIFEKYHFAEK